MSTPLSDEALEAIEQRVKKANSDGGGLGSPGPDALVGSDVALCDCCGTIQFYDEPAAAIVDLCRQDVPALLEEVRRLKRDAEEWRECSRDWRSRAERAEKVERIHRDALVRIEGGHSKSREVASEALREGREVEAERITSE